MFKAVFAILTTVLGGAAMAFAAYLQHQPRALTTPKLELATVTPSISRATDTALHRLETDSQIIMTDEIVVQGRLTKRPAPQPLVREPIALRPCSEWWELDPRSRVRKLCT